MSASVDPAFWRGRRVLVTGHTGFKGAWAWLWLASMGAELFGYSRPPPAESSLYKLAGLGGEGESLFGDLGDVDTLSAFMARARPEIVIHLAAQAFVRRAHRDPVDTFRTNVQGTVNLLDALKGAPGLRAVLVVTTDKVYLNKGGHRPFKESDPLGGSEPYSASKVGQEMAAQAYGRSYFEPAGVWLATARGGNVIGGGDFGEDRLVPDIVRAARDGASVAIRNPDATRPWQHVLDCLSGYLVYVQALMADPSLPRAVNIGPSAPAGRTVAELAERMCRRLDAARAWSRDPEAGPPEAPSLALDVSLAADALGWSDRLSSDDTIDATADWYRQFLAGADMRRASLEALHRFLAAKPIHEQAEGTIRD